MKNIKDFSITPRIFLIIASLFFLWGLFTCINALMIPYLEQLFFSKQNISFNFNNTFFGAYFIISIPAVYLLNRKGYKKSIMLGLLIIASGVFLFVFAASYISYLMFFTGIFLMAAGITILQVAANTYILLMGDENFAVNRLSLAQAINSSGYIAGLLFIFSGNYQINPSIILTANAMKIPYLLLGVLLILLLILFLRSKLPVFDTKSPAYRRSPLTGSTQSAGFPVIIKNPGILFGAMAIFFYVGAEIGISYYIGDLHELAGMPGNYLLPALIIYWGSMGLGRLAGFYLFRGRNSLGIFSRLSVLAIITIVISVFIPHSLSFWLFSLLGLLNGVMFPVIFAESLQRFKGPVNLGAGILVMGISGGAVIPKGLDIIKNTYGFQSSLLLLVFSYLFLLAYGWFYYRAYKSVRFQPV